MQFALVQSSYLPSFYRESTRISIGGAIPRWMESIALVARRSLYAVCTELRTRFSTFSHPQLSVNMQFALEQSSYLRAFGGELTRIFNGSVIPRWMGSMGLGSVQVCTLFGPNEGPDLQPPHTLSFLLICNIALVQSSYLPSYYRESRISNGGAIPRWRMEIWETSKLSITMVPPLHQSNVHIKR